jgi:hypothetical protein
VTPVQRLSGRVCVITGIGIRSGEVVIDATNDFDPSDLDGRTSSEVVAMQQVGAPLAGVNLIRL